MKKFDVTYSYEVEGKNSLGEISTLRVGYTVSVDAENVEQAKEIIKEKFKEKKSLRVSA